MTIPTHVLSLINKVYGRDWGRAYLEWGTFPAAQQFTRQGFGRARDAKPPNDQAVFWSAGLIEDGKGRSNDSVERVMVFVVDDVGTTAKSKIDPGYLALVMPEPTIRIESSPGNWQWQWGITGGLDVADYAALRAGMPFRSDATAPSNLIRLPMGVNGKPGVIHDVAGSTPGPVYSGEEFIRLCGGLRVPVAAVRASADALRAPSLPHVAAALAALPNDGAGPWCKDHAAWITFGMALYGATGGEKFDVWEVWNSSQPQKRDLRYVWDSFHDTGLGWPKLAWLAREYGMAVFEAELAALAPGSFDDGVVASGGGGLPNAKQLKYAQDIARRHGGGMRYVLDRKAWALFDGAVWRHLPSGIKLAGQYAMEMALRAPPRDKGEHDVTTLSFLDGVEGLCRQIPALQAREMDFDRDPWLLGTPGGTVDLRTGALRQADAGDMISKCTAVTPSEAAACPRWVRFVEEVTAGDLESSTFLQQWAGYSLTGLTVEEKILFLYGPGGNGKSKFADMLAWVLGGYFAKPAGDMFIKKAMGMGHTSKLAMLAGARLCTISEVPAGAEWDEGLLKDITGGGLVTAGFKHKDEFSFEPAFKLMAYGNHQPTFPGGINEAIRRRFMMMEFKFHTDTPDLELLVKLKKEGPGVLRWMIDGCLSWAKTELIVPGRVRAATDKMFRGQDLVAQWMDERVGKMVGSTTSATDLYKDWIEWRNAHGNHSLLESMTAFGTEMTDKRGLVKKRTKNGMEFQDIKINARAAGVFDEND